MADEIVYVTVTASIVEIVEVDANEIEPIVIDVRINEYFEGFTFIEEVEPETDRDGHTWYKPSTRQSYIWHNLTWNPLVPEVAVPSGTIIQGGWLTVPTGCAFLNGQTITNGALLYPTIAAQYPSWVSGNHLILPDIAGMVLLATNGTAGTRPVTSNAKTVTITANNLPAHSHGVGSLVTGTESQGHVHYAGSGSGPVGGWQATAYTGGIDTDHSHYSGHAFVIQFGGGDARLGPMGVYGPYNTSGISTNGVSSGHGHGLTGYVSGAHQSHTHAISGSTANNTTTATALPYNTTPAHMLVKYAVKL